MIGNYSLLNQTYNSIVMMNLNRTAPYIIIVV